MKQCPDCAGKNQETNLFCPMCGHSFIDDPVGGGRAGREGDAEGKSKPVVKGVENRRLITIIAIVVVVFLTLVAGLFRFGGWWFIFFFPGIFGWWGRSNQVRNRQNRQRRN